ncbi:Maf family protein [Legionella yabuuchiae]|uniref:Maf family protein n=1 Tax=Legionella yabuuchiae TaxID=376727 RepID=UPI00105576A0|nr:Maf family protein [Legionella yabuuchiae]
MKIYLASKSPRRRELLRQMGVDFEVLSIDIPEVMLPNETPEQYSMRVTREKLSTAWDKILTANLPALPVLCADTEVVCDGTILGKPRDYDDALSMLKRYSGRSHKVLTSVGIKFFDHQTIDLNATTVYFASMSDAEIHLYLALEDYKDKAGGYGIHSYIGQYIYRIDGCFFSVMGLPLNSVRELLKTLPDCL